MAELVLPMLRLDQYRIARHPAKVKVLAMGRRWGKSTMLGAVSLNAARRGARVAWVVPTYRNGNALWRFAEAAVGALRAAGQVRTNRSERLIEFPGSGGFLGIYSADSADSIRGEWFHLVAVDEAARIDEAVWADVLQPTLADVDGDAILISTPKGRNWFHRLWQAGHTDMRDSAAFRAPTDDNPNPLIRKAANRARLLYGEDGSTYRQEWCAEFVDAAGTAWLREWAEDRYDPDDEALARSAVARIISYDTAMKDKVENAYTACVVADLLPDYRLLVRHVWRERLLFPNLVDAMQRDIDRWNADGKLWAILIEDVVSGTSAYQTLMRTGDESIKAKLHAIKPTGSKDQRFETAGVWLKNHRVLLPKPAASVRWLHAYEGEVFEEGEFKDQRDGSSQLINWMQDYLGQGLQMPPEAA